MHGRCRGSPGEVGRAAHRLGDLPESGAVAVRAAATVAGDAQHDQRGKLFMQRGPAQPARSRTPGRKFSTTMSACRISP